MYGGVNGSLFKGFSLSDFVGKYLPVPAQGYCVDVHARVNFNSLALGSHSCDQQQCCIEGDLSV